MWNGEALFQSKNERIGFSHTCVAIVSIVPSKPLPRLDWRPNCTTIKQKMLRTVQNGTKGNPQPRFTINLIKIYPFHITLPALVFAKLCSTGWHKVDLCANGTAGSHAGVW